MLTKIKCFCFVALLMLHSVAWADFEADLTDTGKFSGNLTLSQLRERAWAGDAEAQLQMGSLYFDGKDATRDYTMAAKWFRLAARQGNARAQFSLGVMYDAGLGVVQNQAEAVSWYRRAALQGLASAQLNLGVAYSQGQGVVKSDADAIKWFRLAADQGQSQAQFNLALMYAKGQGAAQDFDEAYRWARLSADQGNEQARVLEQKLSEKIAQRNNAGVAEKKTDQEAENKSGGNDVYVQIAAFKSERLAEKFRQLLSAKLGDVGKPIILYTEDNLVRIQLGPYPDEADARVAADGLKIRLGIVPLLKRH